MSENGSSREGGAVVQGHTPGPWRAGRPDMATIVDGVDSKWIYADDPRDPDNARKSQYVAVASGQIDGPWEEVMANAHLIAAAPDLLAALQTLENWASVRVDYPPPPAVVAARVAIAKARGLTFAQHPPDSAHPSVRQQDDK